MASLGPARQQDGSLNQRAVSALNAMHEAFEGQVLVWEPSTQAAPEGGLGIAGLPALALTGGVLVAGHTGISAGAADDVHCDRQLAALLGPLMLQHAVRPLVSSGLAQYSAPHHGCSCPKQSRQHTCKAQAP